MLPYSTVISPCPSNEERKTSGSFTLLRRNKVKKKTSNVTETSMGYFNLKLWQSQLTTLFIDRPAPLCQQLFVQRGPPRYQREIGKNLDSHFLTIRAILYIQTGTTGSIKKFSFGGGGRNFAYKLTFKLSSDQIRLSVFQNKKQKCWSLEHDFRPKRLKILIFTYYLKLTLGQDDEYLNNFESFSIVSTW
jgi:hypothetical protein